MNAEKQFFKRPAMNSVPSRGKTSLSIKDNRSSAIKQCQLKRAIQRAVNEYEDKVEARDAFKTSFVREDHFDDISTRSSNNVLSIRETGDPSLKRLGEGAKPKPHSVLDKSIKQSRLNATNVTNLGRLGIPIDDIEGFVGYWDKEEQLIGLILANIPQKEGVEMQNISQTEKGKNYIELSRFTELQTYDDWKQCLYTGDYDLHEVYDDSGELIPEGDEKATLLNKLNGLDENPITANAHGVLGSVPENAYFQHGDQATYRESAHNEANEKTSKDIAVLVPSVAVEETDSLAWFVKNSLWFISHSRDEHKDVRGRIKEKKGIELKIPKTWEEDATFEPKDISSFSKTLTKPYIAPYSGYKSGKLNERFQFSYPFADDFQVDPSILEGIAINSANHIPPENADATKMAIAKTKAINLMISNYRGITGAQKQHYTWKVGDITYYYNGEKKYCVEVADKTIKGFHKENKVIPPGAISI